MKIINKEYSLKTNKISNKNIVLIADTHYYSKKDIIKLNKISDKIKLLNPDYICITGDLIDEAIIKDEDIFINWLSNLSNICKVIISIGNHDITIRKGRKEYINECMFDKIKKIKNIHILDNDYYIDDNITFIGITNSCNYYNNHEKFNEFVKELNRLKFKLNKKNYNILLCHSPISIVKEEITNKCLILKNIDLVLCGHMHGGIVPRFLVPVMKNRGFIDPLGRLFINNAYGFINKNNINYIISSGITKASHSNPFSFMNQLFYSEIVKIKVI